MKIEIVDLAEENLKHAPEWEIRPFSCKYCLYWESAGKDAGGSTDEGRAGLKDAAMRRKLEWLRRTHAEFGNCGKLIFADDVAVGYAQYAPPSLLPNTTAYPAGPPSPDAVFLSCLFIPRDRYRTLSLGSQLLQSVLDDLKRRGIPAVETFARKGKADNPSGPVEFYLQQQFAILRDDPEFPLLRRDLG